MDTYQWVKDGKKVEPSLRMNQQNEIGSNTLDVIGEKMYIPKKRFHKKFLKIQYIVISIVIIIAVIVIAAIIIPNRSNSHSEPKKPQNYEEFRLIIRTNDSILNYDYKTNKVHFSQKLQHFGAFEMLGNEVFWSTIDFPKIVSKKNEMIDDPNDNLDVIFQEGRVNPTAMSLDFITNKLYVVDKTAGTLIIVDLKSKKYGLCLSDLLNPQEVVLDLIHGYMFILQFSKNILRGNMDGSDLEIVQKGTITTIALDFETERIYWVKNSVYIESSDYFGKETTSCLKDHVPIISLAIIDRQLFWLWPADNHSNSTLWTCEIQSTGRCKNHYMEEIDLHNATYLKSYSMKVKSSTFNPCSLHNGGCQHLCLLTSWANSGRTCACYLGWQTGSDSRTCERVRDGVLFTAGDFVRIRTLSINDRTSFADAILPTHFEAGITIRKGTIDFEYDSIREEFYWSDDSNIFKKSLKQTEETVTVQVSEPDYVMQDLAMDRVSGNMYYSKCSQISKDDHKLLVFSIAKPIFQRTLLSIKYRSNFGSYGCPYSLVIDSFQGSLYFMAEESGRYLYKLTISGSRLNRIFDVSLFVREHSLLAIDNRQNAIYQIESKMSTAVMIKSTVLEINYPSNKFSVPLGDAKTIDVQQDWLYLSTLDAIFRTNKTTGKNLTRIWPRPFFEPRGNVTGVRVIDSNVEAAYKRSFCIINNGGCQQLCFSAPTKTCNCSDGHAVQNDGSCF